MAILKPGTEVLLALAELDLIAALGLDPDIIIEGVSVEPDGTFTYKFHGDHPAPLGEITKLESGDFPTATAYIAPLLARTYLARVEDILNQR